MTPDQYATTLATVTYQPGWTLSIWWAIEGPTLRVEATVADAYAPDKTTDLGIDSPIPPCATEHDFLTWLRWRLGRIAVHESDEWLRRDGAALFDPHAEPIR